MNKEKFIKEIEKKGFTKDEAIKINNVLENNSIVGRKNKKKLIKELMENNFSEDNAENIYDISVEIILSNIKKKILHPFSK